MSWQPVSAAPITQRDGQGAQGAHVVERQRQLGAGDRQPRGAAADGDDEPVCAPGPAILGPDRVRIEEAGVAGLLDQVDARRADVIGHVLALVGVPGYPVGVGESRGEVHLRPRPAEAERLPRAPVPHEAGGPGQRAHGRRALIQGRPAHAPPLDEADVGAELGGLERGRCAGGAAAKDEHAHHAAAVISTTT